jgi:hypothetical protein
MKKVMDRGRKNDISLFYMVYSTLNMPTQLLYGCSELLDGSRGVIKTVMRNGKLYFVYEKEDELDALVVKMNRIQIK